MDYPELREILSTEEEIEAILGKPAPRIVAKTINALDEICLSYIARAPFVIVASCDAAGRMDVSPKGDPAGSCRCLIGTQSLSRSGPAIGARIPFGMCCKIPGSA